MWFIIWNVINLIVMYARIPDSHMKREDMLDMRNRIVSIIHGTLCMFLSGYNTYFVHSQCGEGNTHFEDLIMQFSCSYFLYDLVAMAFLGILDTSMFIHHNICVFGMLAGLL